MLFNSLEFIMIFFPVAGAGYFTLGKIYPIISRYWLLLISLLFYSWWDISYLPLLIFSMIVNYFLGIYLLSTENNVRKMAFYAGLLFNLTILFFYKYKNFFIQNLNFFFKSNAETVDIYLPLAISFFTFHQIIFLTEKYRNNTSNKESFVDYCLYICFFPQLIAGPLIRYSEIIFQFKDKKNTLFSFENFNKGLFVFSLGLFKKVVIADSLSDCVHRGFDASSSLSFVEGWITSISYTLQLYFDFSGYSDMALGLALMLNIKLPVNFFSPYKALNIQDFWRRWHITLSQFFKDYVYIPLGGKDPNMISMTRNIIITFFLTGLWHGADWLFIVWGLIHGFGLIIYNITKPYLFFMNRWLSWFTTFMFVNFAWIFFRAHSFADAKKIIYAMFDVSIISFPLWMNFQHSLVNIHIDKEFMIIFIGALTSILCLKNTNELVKDFNPTLLKLLISTGCLCFSILRLHKNSEFIYFNF